MIEFKQIRKSEKYKYVWLCKIGKNHKWRGQAGGCNGKYFEDEREAAVFVDKQLLNKGKKHVNILVPK